MKVMWSKEQEEEKLQNETSIGTVGRGKQKLLIFEKKIC